MKALTICQPYAEMIASGEKRIENRTWYTGYRGPLAIHAGKSLGYLRLADMKRWPDMVFGAIIAVGRLVACVPVNVWRDLHRPNHRDWKYAEGPWCWLLRDVRRLDRPIPCSGKLRLWALSDGIAEQMPSELTVQTPRPQRRRPPC